ncbi:choice-of-anchor C family protein [Neolewinella litorea]|nr:choice-of-anchor C family protein [Neolewinella litorea]
MSATLAGQAIPNGSVEQATQNPGNSFIRLFAGDQIVTNWRVESGSIDYIGTYWTAADGRRSFDMNGTEPGAVSTFINTTAGEQYYLQFAFAGNPNCDGPPVKELKVTANDSSRVYRFDVTGKASQNMGWRAEIFSFVATSGQTTVTFTSQNPGHCGPAIDNLVLVEVDCAGTVNGTAVTDECGVCLEPGDPAFNQTCTDCAGTVNGTAVVDDCGVCLLPSDPGFNQSCSDCAGTVNGSAVVDDCGKCLEPTDPAFNVGCTDCAGTVDGTAVVDACGVCLEPRDSTFNQSCVDCGGTPNGIAMIDDCGRCLEPDDPEFSYTCQESIYIPSSFSPNGDDVNDVFELFKNSEVVARIADYRIYSRWGELVYEARDFEFSDTDRWWDGRFRGKSVNVGPYVYSIEVLSGNGRTEIFRGEVMVVNPGK